MAQPINILKSKLLIPSLARTIQRERLRPLLAQIDQKRITTVISGAGFGKSTLVAQAVTSRRFDTVWYRLDRYDSDFGTFVHYLIEGIKPHYPGFGSETAGRIENTQKLNLECDAILSVFLHETERVLTRDLVIVLDDYHLVGHSPAIRRALTFLVERFSPLIHLVIVSRTAPDLALSLYRARREVLEIDEKEIAFTLAETQALYGEIFGVELAGDRLEMLLEKTQGWVSGLILIYLSLEGKDIRKIASCLDGWQGVHQALFHYFRENVYASLPERFQRFLTRTSILSRLHVDFCDRFLKIGHSRQMLTDLEQRHLFTFALDPERRWFYYHHLFQDFLRRKLQEELKAGEIVALHQRAAMEWEALQEEEESLRHYLAAEDFPRACALLKDTSRKLIKEARLSSFTSYLAAIPPAHIAQEPWLQYSRARALELSGRLKEAIEAYTSARHTFEKQRHVKGAGLCLNRLGSQYYLRGDFSRAKEMLEPLLGCVRDNVRLWSDIMGHLIFIAGHVGAIDKADRLYQTAVERLSDRRHIDLCAWIEANYAFRFFTTGDLPQAVAMAEQSRDICEAEDLSYLLAFNYHLISISQYYLGRFSKGLAIALAGHELIRARGYREASYAWLMIDACLNAAALGRDEDAVRYGSEGLHICRNLGSIWSEAWAHHALALAHERRGDPAAAETSAKTALKVIRQLSLPLDEAVMETGYGRFLLGRGEYAAAEALLTAAAEKMSISRFNLCRIHLFLARLFWETGRHGEALDRLGQGLGISRTHKLDFLVRTEKDWIVPPMAELCRDAAERPYVKQLLAGMDVDLAGVLGGEQERPGRPVAAVLKELDIPPPPLKVHCLGKFRLFRGDVEIPPAAWTSAKARRLFQYLVCRRPAGFTPKEMLLELMWPEEDPEKTSRRLHVALTHLRRTLEPGRAQRTPSTYLLRQADAYCIQTGDGGWVDVEAFQEALAMAGKAETPEGALPHLLRAAEGYTGDLLSEEPYTPWCMDARNALKDRYLAALESIIAIYEARKDYAASIAFGLRYQAANPYEESIYRRLMRHYAAAGQRSQLEKTYQTCREKLQEGLDSPPSPSTRKLYQQLQLSLSG